MGVDVEHAQYASFSLAFVECECGSLELDNYTIPASVRRAVYSSFQFHLFHKYIFETDGGAVSGELFSSFVFSRLDIPLPLERGRTEQYVVGWRWGHGGLESGAPILSLLLHLERCCTGVGRHLLVFVQILKAVINRRDQEKVDEYLGEIKQWQGDY